jgi:integration host factor subunit alpha
MTIIKDDIVNDVMKKVKLDRNMARNLVESIIKHLKITLTTGDDVMITGFGNFRVTHKKARIGRNPKSLVTYEISERKVVVFNPSKVLRKEMNPN